MDDKFDKAPVDGAIQHLAQPLSHVAQATLATMGVALSPVWTIPIVLAFGLYGFYLFYKQDELNKFMNWIKEHPNEFTKSVVNQRSFQDGFIITLEEYLRARTEEKKEMVQLIFLGFTKSENKEDFELERFHEIVKLISVSQVKALRLFIRDDRYIRLSEEGGEDRSDYYYHEQYETIKSLTTLDLVTIYTKNLLDPIYFESKENEIIPQLNKKEFVELTSFGNSFISYLNKI